MTTKKGSTKGKAADSKAKPKAITLTTTLPAEMFDGGEFHVTLEEMEGYRRHGEYLARLIEHERTPPHFDVAIEALFSDFYSEVAGIRFTIPALFRILYPLALTAAGKDEAGRFEQTCVVLTEALIPEALRESLRKGVFGD